MTMSEASTQQRTYTARQKPESVSPKEKQKQKMCLLIVIVGVVRYGIESSRSFDTLTSTASQPVFERVSREYEYGCNKRVVCI